MRVAGVLGAIALALALQTTLAPFMAADGMAVDLVLIVVVCVALAWGPVAGLLTGTAGGLAQDTLSGGIIGVGGLTNTLVGFLVGIVGTQFIVTQMVVRFVIFFCASLVQSTCFLGLYTLLDPRPFPVERTAILVGALGNAVVGVLVFQVLDLVPEVAQRRRTGRDEARRKQFRD